MGRASPAKHAYTGARCGVTRMAEVSRHGARAAHATGFVGVDGISPGRPALSILLLKLSRRNALRQMLCSSVFVLLASRAQNPQQT